MVNGADGTGTVSKIDPKVMQQGVTVTGTVAPLAVVTVGGP